MIVSAILSALPRIFSKSSPNDLRFGGLLSGLEIGGTGCFNVTFVLPPSAPGDIPKGLLPFCSSLSLLKIFFILPLRVVLPLAASGFVAIVLLLGPWLIVVVPLGA